MKKEIESAVPVTKQICPICSRPTLYAYNVEEEQEPNKGSGIWYKCSCGVIFQLKYPTGELYDKKYITECVESKEFADRSIHSYRTYINLIEELTYGRKWLDVGYCYERPMEWLRDRGWITWGIDINKTAKESEYLIKGDFEKHEFREKKFDVIWMGHVLEHFKNPLKALQKAKDLTLEDGVVVITTPDIDFLYQVSPVRFPYWKHKEHYVLWTKEALKREAEKLGFQVIMCRSNFSERFMNFWNVDLILQKIYA